MKRFSRKRRRIQGGGDDDTFWSWISSLWSKSPAPANADVDKQIELTKIYTNKSEYENDKDFEVPEEVEERRKTENKRFEGKKQQTMKTFYNKPLSNPQQKTEVLSDDDASGYIRKQLGIIDEGEIAAIIEKYNSDPDLLYRMYITMHIFPRLTDNKLKLSEEDLANIIMSLDPIERNKFFVDVHNLTYGENDKINQDLKAAEDLVRATVSKIIKDDKWEQTQKSKSEFNANINMKPQQAPSALHIDAKRKERAKKQAVFTGKNLPKGVNNRPAGGKKTRRHRRKRR